MSTMEVARPPRAVRFDQSGRARIGKTAVRAGLYVLMAVIVFVVAFPLFWMVSTAFKPSSEIFVTPPTLVPAHPTLENFHRLFVDTSFAVFFGNSVVVALATVALTLGVASSGAYALTRYTWPGNVRELENTIERAVVIAPGNEITKECLRTEISDPKSAVSGHQDGASNAAVSDIGRGINFYEEVRRFEIDLIRRALEQTGGHQSRAARLLGMNATTLNSKIKTYNINLRP